MTYSVTRALAIGVLALTALVASARPARADIWDWMQEWSGPGPFSSNQPIVMWRFKCSYEGINAAARDAARRINDAESCLFADFRSLTADENDNFPIKVTVRFADFGVTRKVRVWRFQKSIDAGVGLGLMTAAGDEAAGGTRATRLTLTAPRLVVKPLMLVPELFGIEQNFTGRWSRLARVLKLHVGGTLIVGPLDAQDLGVDRARSDFSRSFEYVLSRGFAVDVGELIFPLP